MRQTREILRLHFESHLAPRQIARICKVAKSTVQRYLERLKAAGLSWPLPVDLDDVALERRLFPPPPVASPEERCLPDCGAIHREMKSRENVTLQLLWEEYKQANPLGYAYSWYCELYREWQRRLDVVLRHEHRAGEKTYMALGTIHVLADGRPSTTLVMCPSHITHKWAREVLLTIPRARAFLIEDMRNGGDPSRPHGICEVNLSKGETVYEGNRNYLAWYELRLVEEQQATDLALLRQLESRYRTQVGERGTASAFGPQRGRTLVCASIALHVPNTTTSSSPQRRYCVG
jgi:hypothetical protein